MNYPHAWGNLGSEMLHMWESVRAHASGVGYQWTKV